MNGIARGRIVEALPTDEGNPFARPDSVIIRFDNSGEAWHVPASCVGAPPRETFETLLPSDWLPSPAECDRALHGGLYFCTLKSIDGEPEAADGEEANR